jgi:long-chain fatty acid transport protein
MWVLSDALRLGVGVNVPFGLETDYDRDWIGRYHAVHSELMTVNINPALAWRVFPGVTLGAGFQAQYADAELSNAVDFGTIGAAAGLPGAVPGNPAQDGFAKLEGDDWGYGWNAGILLEPLETTRFGVAYRSKIEHTLEGDVEFSGPAPLLGAFRTTGNFVDTGVKADLTTPESWSFGAYHEITPKVAVMAEAALTRWSRFDELRIRFDSAQGDSVTEEDWDDSWFYALGVTWRPREGCALRLGVAHDEEPIPDANRTPRIPGEDRTWLAVGTNLQVSPNLALDFGYTHIWVEDSSLQLNAGTSPDHPDFFRGNLTGSYENAIDIVTAQATWRF